MSAGIAQMVEGKLCDKEVCFEARNYRAELRKSACFDDFVMRFCAEIQRNQIAGAEK